jgi:hypothetical protein
MAGKGWAFQPVVQPPAFSGALLNGQTEVNTEEHGSKASVRIVKTEERAPQPVNGQTLLPGANCRSLNWPPPAAGDQQYCRHLTPGDFPVAPGKLSVIIRPASQVSTPGPSPASANGQLPAGTVFSLRASAGRSRLMVVTAWRSQRG